MAKALLGHVGPDLRLVSEVQRLRRRIEELEAELEAVNATHDFERSLRITADPRIPEPEPALT